MKLDNHIVGKVIQQIRNEKGLSQEVLSGFAGIARTHLTMIENGTKKPNLETIFKISEALNMKPSDLIKQIEDAFTDEVE